MNTEQSVMVMTSLHSQLRKDNTISIAEKALIYAQTADYYNLSLSEIGNPFVSESERSEHPVRTIDADQAAAIEKAQLGSIKRAWAHQAEQAKRKRKGILIVATVTALAAAAMLIHWWMGLGVRP